MKKDYYLAFDKKLENQEPERIISESIQLMIILYIFLFQWNKLWWKFDKTKWELNCLETSKPRWSRDPL